MSKDNHVKKNKEGAQSNKARQYSDINSDEDIKLSGKYLNRIFRKFEHFWVLV